MIVSSVESILKTLAIFYKCGIQATNNAIFSRLHHDYVQLTITKHKHKTSDAFYNQDSKFKILVRHKQCDVSKSITMNLSPNDNKGHLFRLKVSIHKRWKLPENQNCPCNPEVSLTRSSEILA